MNLKFSSNFKGPFSGFGHFLTTASPLKMTENAFSFIFKLCLFLRYLHSCPDFLVMQRYGLIRNLRLISKFMASQTGQQIKLVKAIKK